MVCPVWSGIGCGLVGVNEALRLLGEQETMCRAEVERVPGGGGSPGEDPRAARHGERVGHRLKMLVAADLVIEAVPGEFTPGDGSDPTFR